MITVWDFVSSLFRLFVSCVTCGRFGKQGTRPAGKKGDSDGNELGFHRYYIGGGRASRPDSFLITADRRQSSRKRWRQRRRRRRSSDDQQLISIPTPSNSTGGTSSSTGSSSPRDHQHQEETTVVFDRSVVSTASSLKREKGQKIHNQQQLRQQDYYSFLSSSTLPPPNQSQQDSSTLHTTNSLQSNQYHQGQKSNLLYYDHHYYCSAQLLMYTPEDSTAIQIDGGDESCDCFLVSDDFNSNSRSRNSSGVYQQQQQQQRRGDWTRSLYRDEDKNSIGGGLQHQFGGGSGSGGGFQSSFHRQNSSSSSVHRGLITSFLSKPFRCNPLKRTKSVSKLLDRSKGTKFENLVDERPHQLNQMNGGRFVMMEDADNHRHSFNPIQATESNTNPGNTGDRNSLRQDETSAASAAAAAAAYIAHGQTPHCWSNNNNQHIQSSTNGTAGTTEGILRSARSHESLLDYRQQQQQQKHPIVATECHTIDLDTASTASLTALHPSVLGTPNCIQLRLMDGTNKVYACRNAAERDRWIATLRRAMNPNQERTHRVENSLHLWILEAKGLPAKSRRFFVEMTLDNVLYARTSAKPRTDSCFWGENFEFNHLPDVDTISLNLYRETDKKKKKERIGSTMVGYVEIPVQSLLARHPIEKWYSITMSSENHGSRALASRNSSSGEPVSIRVKAKFSSVHVLPLQLYSDLIHSVRHQYLRLSLALESALSVKAKEDFAISLIRILQKENLATEYLTDLIMVEVDNLDNEHLMFRGNSLATKAMEAYLKLVGDHYLQETLGSFVRHVLESDNDCEVDPQKLSNMTSLDKHQKLLTFYVEAAWGKIVNSVANFPPELCNVFQSLRQRLAAIGRPELADNVISSSIFLRFLCPAILSPSLFNLVTEFPTGRGARSLTLIAKTVQTLANFTKFGGKENYMEFMNSFVDKEWDEMQRYLRQISSQPTGGQHQQSVYDGCNVDIGKELSLVHSYLLESWPSLNKASQTEFSPLRDILERLSDAHQNPNSYCCGSDESGTSDELDLSSGAKGNNKSIIKTTITTTTTTDENRNLNINETGKIESEKASSGHKLGFPPSTQPQPAVFGFPKNVANTLNTADEYVTAGALSDNLTVQQMGLSVQNKRRNQQRHQQQQQQQQHLQQQTMEVMNEVDGLDPMDPTMNDNRRNVVIGQLSVVKPSSGYNSLNRSSAGSSSSSSSTGSSPTDRKRASPLKADNNNSTKHVTLSIANPLYSIHTIPPAPLLSKKEAYRSLPDIQAAAIQDDTTHIIIGSPQKNQISSNGSSLSSATTSSTEEEEEAAAAVDSCKRVEISSWIKNAPLTLPMSVGGSSFISAAHSELFRRPAASSTINNQSSPSAPLNAVSNHSKSLKTGTVPESPHPALPVLLPPPRTNPRYIARVNQRNSRTNLMTESPYTTKVNSHSIDPIFMVEENNNYTIVDKNDRETSPVDGLAAVRKELLQAEERLQLAEKHCSLLTAAGNNDGANNVQLGRSQSTLVRRPPKTTTNNHQDESTMSSAAEAAAENRWSVNAVKPIIGQLKRVEEELRRNTARAAVANQDVSDDGVGGGGDGEEAVRQKQAIIDAQQRKIDSLISANQRLMTALSHLTTNSSPSTANNGINNVDDEKHPQSTIMTRPEVDNDDHRRSLHSSPSLDENEADNAGDSSFDSLTSTMSYVSSQSDPSPTNPTINGAEKEPKFPVSSKSISMA